jgi:hypothetical protein
LLTQKGLFFLESSCHTLSQHDKKRREKTQINKIRGEKGYITTNTNEIKRIIRKYFENLYSSKLESLNEMDKFIDVYNQP